MELNPKPGFSAGGYLPYTLPPDLAAMVVKPNTLKTEDERWMFVAFLEAMKGVGTTNPNPAVGAVFVKNGAEIATGFTENYRLRHAERVAFDSLQDKSQLHGATAYVTLEPCSHQGHQPPCVDLFLHSGISRVVIAGTDPNPKVHGESIKKLQQNGIQVDVGVLKSEALLWHLPFIASTLLKRPIWVGKWAETKNGILADNSGESKWITGPIARAYGHWLRMKYDAVLVGAGTVLKDAPQLTVRDCRAPIHRQPLRLVFDPKGLITEISPALQDSVFSNEAKTVLFCKEGATPKNLMRSTHVFALKSKDPLSELRLWVASPEAEQIFGKPLQSIYVEGGARLLTSILLNGGFDIIHRFIGLKSTLTGDKYKIGFADHQTQYQVVSQHTLGDDTLSEYLSQTLAKLIPNS